MHILKNTFILSTFTICSITGLPAFANDSDGFWLSLEGGVSFLQDPDNTTVQPMPGVNLPDNYVTDSLENTGVIGVGVGYTFTLNDDDDWFPSNRIGLYYDYYFPATASGHIEKWQSTEVYTYSFDVMSNTLWLGNQLDLFEWNHITPFFDLGAGVAWNTTKNYDETPLAEVPDQDRRDLSADFAKHTHSSFAWRVGLGANISLPCCEDWNLGILYRYADLGDAKTGSSENYPTADNSLEADLRSNEILANIRYDF